MLTTVLRLAALVLIVAVPAAAQVQARVGDSVRLDTADGVIEGRLVKAEGSALVLAIGAHTRQSIAATSVDRLLVQRDIPGTGKGARTALIVAGAIFALGVITEPDNVRDDAWIDVDERDEHWLGIIIFMPLTVLGGFLIGNSMHDTEWVEARLPDDVTRRHASLLQRLEGERAWTRPAGLSFTRSF